LRPQDNPKIDIYSGEIRREVTVFPWWNHWPVAQRPTDGRFAMIADRPSHSSLSHWFWDAYSESDRSMVKLMLTGMTDKSAEELLPLAKSWSNPPNAESEEADVKFDQTERAFFVNPKKNAENITIKIAASAGSPLVNPGFVVFGWNESPVHLKVNGKIVDKGENFRTGYRHNLNSTDLIMWLRIESDNPIQVNISN